MFYYICVCAYLRGRDDRAIWGYSEVGAIHEGQIFPHGDSWTSQDMGEVETVAHVLQ